MGKILAAYGGGFKPPTAGHFEIVKRALQDYPEIDEFTIFVGGKVRDGIEQTESVLVWDIYKRYLANKVKIEPVKSPIGDILRLAKNNPQDIIYFVIGYREGRQDDLDDVSARTGDIEKKYPNIVVKVIPTYDPNMSGTNARKALNKSEKEFIEFLPSEVEEKSEIYSILRPPTNESINENATYSEYIDYKQMIVDLVDYMIENNRNILPLPDLEFIDGDDNNAKNFFGRTAYYDPNTKTIVLYTEGRHPKDIVRSFAHEMVHHTQNLEDRIGNLQTTDTTADEDLDAIEREAYSEGNMMFRNWTDSIDGDVSSSITEAIVDDKIECDKCNWSWKIKDGGNDLFICHKCGHDNEFLNENKDHFGINKFIKEVAKEVLNEGKYDSLVTKLAGYTLNAWKGDFEDSQNKGYFSLKVGPGEEFEYPYLKFLYIAKANFVDDFNSSGVARPIKKPIPEVELNYRIPIDELPRMWEQISMDIRNVIRHEIEHLMQSGINVKTGKEMESDSAERDELKTGKKPWWKIWRKKLGTPDYYKLEKEIDANLQGLYLKAKKSRKPLKNIIDNYLKYELNLDTNDQRDIKNLWRNRAPKLNIPLFENEEKYKIFSDMDGVLTDFDESFKKYSDGIAPSDYEKKYGKEEFWKLIDGQGKVGFWVGMPWMKDGKQYWDYIKNYDTELLSSPSRSATSRLGKRLWVRNNMPGIKLTLAQASKKQNYAAPNHILIDDRKSNIEQWRAQGGIGILHTSASDTISQLKKLGL
tara:strand:+ start:1204 stop:3468 length:2265 start_codon:yes stop_codon:yes gene_type:complete